MSDKILILHLINDCTDGSIARIVERIIRYSPKDEFVWYVGHLKPGQSFSENIQGAGGNLIDFSWKPGENLSPGQQIRKFVIEQNIQIIHSHTMRTIFTVWSSLNLRWPSVKSTVIHLATKHTFTQVGDRRFGLFFSVIDRISVYMADHLIPVSRSMAKTITALPGIFRSKVTAIPNAIPVEDYYQPQERIDFRNEIGLSPQMLAIGFTGRITRVKCLDLLLEAFDEVFPLYPHARLVIAGEGELRLALEAQAQRLKINNAVIWLGFCDDIPRMLSGIDIYVQPSMNEGLSLSILEAMASETPVIVTHVGSAEEIIEDGVNGILIEPGLSEDIATALMTLLSNEQMRKRLARKGREFVVEEFNVQKMVNGYCDIYRQQKK